MHYDFTSTPDRRGMDALALDVLYQEAGPGAENLDIIPMWVADMNFATVPTVPQAIIRRVEHPLYGYFRPRQAYFDAIRFWQSRRNGVTGLADENILYANGVLGGVISALNVLCSRGDQVLVHAPTYIGFTHALEDNGYHIVHSPLVPDGAGVWRMDLEDMERKLRENHIHAAILCSPHNPTGRVWERWELEEAMALFQKYDVGVISDEIWSDLTLTGYRHIPTQSVSADARARTVALYAPSKTFNLAGLVGSYAIVYDPRLRDQMEKESGLSHCNNMNLLSMYALMGAYCPEGEQWLEELRQVLTGNVDYACGYISDRFPGVTVRRPQGTYLLFPDCSEWCREHGKTVEELVGACKAAGVAPQNGEMFHGKGCLRMNLALPLSRLEEAFRRLDRYVFNA